MLNGSNKTTNNTLLVQTITAMINMDLIEIIQRYFAQFETYL